MASDPLRLTWWKLWFRWRGRIGREWFWLGSFMVLVIAGAGSGAAFALAKQRVEYMAGGGVLALIGVYALLSIFIKRLHDRNKSLLWILPYCVLPIGLAAAIPQLKQLSPEYWWIAAAVASVIGLWALIELGFLRSKGPNRYGEKAMDEPAIEPPTRPPPAKSEG
ncbi:MAG: DUF805 domain-containing protein [Parvibaculaceae bacterium]